MVSFICGVVASPFIGTITSKVFIPYAKSDTEISKVFEVSTIIAFPIVALTTFVFLKCFFKKRADR